MKIYYPAWQYYEHHWIGPEDIMSDHPFNTQKEAEDYLDLNFSHHGGTSEDELGVFEYDTDTQEYTLLLHW